MGLPTAGIGRIAVQCAASAVYRVTNADRPIRSRLVDTLIQRHFSLWILPIPLIDPRIIQENADVCQQKISDIPVFRLRQRHGFVHAQIGATDIHMGPPLAFPLFKPCDPVILSFLPAVEQIHLPRFFLLRSGQKKRCEGLLFHKFFRCPEGQLARDLLIEQIA